MVIFRARVGLLLAVGPRGGQAGGGLVQRALAVLDRGGVTAVGGAGRQGGIQGGGGGAGQEGGAFTQNTHNTTCICL